MAETLSRSMLMEEPSDRSSTLFPQSMNRSTVTSKRRISGPLQPETIWKIPEALFEDFLSAFVTFRKQVQDFQLTMTFEELCDKQVKTLNKMLLLAPKDLSTTDGAFVEVIDFLKQERATWQLVHDLFLDWLETFPKAQRSASSVTIDQWSSDRAKWQFLYDTDETFREACMIVDWCQRNAAVNFEETAEVTIGYFRTKTFLWDSTLHRQLANKRSDPRRPLVDKMDPDAKLRLGKSLDDIDEADEQAFLKVLFSLIRCGNLSKAADLCAHCGQSWRAVVIRGGVLYHDQNINSTMEVIREPSGDSSRELWKKMCLNLIQQSSVSSAERAIIAALVGHLDSLLPMCTSYEDKLWAYCLSLREEMFDSFRRNTAGAADPSQTTQRLNLAQVFAELGPNDENSSDGFFHNVQKFLLLRQYDDLICYLCDVLGHSNVMHRQRARFCCHLAFQLRSFGIEIDEKSYNLLIEHYIRVLIEDGRAPLVAFYASKLTRDLQVLWYAKFLEGIKEHSERQRCLSLAEENQLDVFTICLAITEILRNDYVAKISQPYPESSSMGGFQFPLGKGVGQDEETVICGIEWLLFDKLMIGEALREVGALSRIFLMNQNLAAVQKLFSLLPDGADKMATAVWMDQNGGNETLTLRQRNVLKDYKCLMAYLAAHTSYTQWFDHYHKRKPLELPSEGASRQAMTFVEKAALEESRKSYEASLAKWKRGSAAFAEFAIGALLHILQYPDGGWMICFPDDEGSSDQEKLMKQSCFIRKACIPLVSNMLIEILYSSERHKEAIAVANLLASEKYLLYKDFDAVELRNVLHIIQKCSVKAMDSGLDAFGYEKTSVK